MFHGPETEESAEPEPNTQTPGNLTVLNGQPMTLSNSKMTAHLTQSGPNSTDISDCTTAQGSGVYELKFLIDELVGHQVRDWARTSMQPDPHAVSGTECGYWVNSLYLDTPAFDVLKRVDGFRQRKYRLRRYGSETAIWMELKRKNNGQVVKRRTTVSEADFEARLASSSDGIWNGRWFQRRLEKLHLRPVCEVTYQRFACVGNSPFGATRLTVDSQLCCARADGWNVPSRPLSTNSLTNHQVLELKFRNTIPIAFRELIEQLKLKPASFSKYRRSVETCIPISELAGDESS
ncbi:MAG: hypothetical protein JWM11_739 [Planctomycetaceae bacterium]|nr:hypothetical protein [Planctomycetaceae bacterium]